MKSRALYLLTGHLPTLYRDEDDTDAEDTQPYQDTHDAEESEERSDDLFRGRIEADHWIDPDDC